MTDGQVIIELAKWLAIAVAVLGFFATIIICFGFWRLDTESAKALTEVSGRYVSVQLITVQVIVLSVFVLGFLGKIPPDRGPALTGKPLGSSYNVFLNAAS